MALALWGIHCHAEPVRVRYVAPSACPDERAFLTRVRSHTDQLELAEPGSLARVLEIRIERAQAGYSARLEFVDSRREHITRTIGGQDCNEVTDALALTVALLVEAAPKLQAPPEPPAARDNPPRSDAVPPQRATTPAPRPARPPPRAAIWSLGFSGRASSQVAPDPSYGLALGLSRLALWNPQGNDLAGGWRTALDINYQDSGPVTFEQTSVRFRLVGVRGALCGAWTLREPVFAELCGAAEVGYWAARAERSQRLPSPRSGSAAWAALGLPMSVGLAIDGLQVFVAAGPWFPLNREQFTFSRPSSVVHEVQPISVSVDLGLRLAL
ncbi:MAG: hypothetical protein R3B07_11480 [Polyangiaceae bacterium]